jgi:uncharacterized protein (DUF1330 family)
MAKGYLVVTYRAINDQEKWSAYAKLAVPAFQKMGGRGARKPGLPSGASGAWQRARTAV